MRIAPAHWHPKDRPCPCCGQGAPLFIACPTCHAIALACMEVGTVFPDPRELGLAADDRQPCVRCGGSRYAAFTVATAAQLADGGFAGGYE